MALDTREERQSAMSLLSGSVMPGVDPAVAGFPTSSRQAAVRSYAGIAAGAAVEGQPTMQRWNPIPFMRLTKPLFGRGF